MHPDLISESPPTLQLNFEPAGKPGRDRDYYMEEKRNICVVCGSDKNCIRKNIVPHEYRRLGNIIAVLVLKSVYLKGMWQYIRAKFRNVAKDRTKQWRNN